MSTQPFHKPDTATETFIVTAVITFFILIGIFFFYAEKNIENTQPSKPEAHSIH